MLYDDVMFLGVYEILLTVLYMSDLHLESQLLFTLRPHCEFRERNMVLDMIRSRLKGIFRAYAKSSAVLVVLAGDISANSMLSGIFIQALNEELRKTFGTGTAYRIIYTLGNHELWQQDFIANNTGYCFKFPNIKRAVSEYKRTCSCVILENEILLLDEGLKTIKSVSVDTPLADIALAASKARYIIFGGIGFSALNPRYNAYTYPRLYANSISGMSEIKLSAKMSELYNYITYLQSLKIITSYQSVICVTHTAVSDWHRGTISPEIYHINGHTHKNILDINNHVFSDNQIGYEPVKWQFKSFNI